jgi:hypothetical protein
LETPKTKPNALLLTSGSLDTGINFVIIKLLVGYDKMEGKMLETWKTGANDRNQTNLDTGLMIIHPGVYYVLPEDIPFLPLFSKPKSGSQDNAHSFIASPS